MGDLNHFNLTRLTKKHGLSSFVETGTYKGSGLRAAAAIKTFEKIVSMDISAEWIEFNTSFAKKDSRITLLKGPSKEMMSTAIEIIEDRPTLWWLDAHLPEACVNKSGRKKFDGDQSLGKEYTFPLEDELKIITEARRDHSKDLFVCDDLRIYESGDFYFGNWKPREKALYADAPSSADFIFDLLKETHSVKRDYRDHGYVIAYPGDSQNG